MTTAPVLTHPLTAQRPRADWFRLVAALLAVAFVAIIAFTVGRTTADTTVPAKVTPLHQTVGQQSDSRCPVAHFC
jgi:hypothetical protein